MMSDFVVIAGVTFLKWLVYTALLWGMIKIQKLQYNVLGLMGSSALATLLNFIPVIGCYIGWIALVLCLWKVMHTDIVPDVLFTVGIAGAIMFCLNLWGFAALMGELRPDLRAHKDSPAIETANHHDALSAPARTIAAVREIARKKAAETASLEEAPRAVPMPASNAPAQPLGTGFKHGLVLKGLVLNSSQPSAMIMSGGKVYTIEEGETLSIPSLKGKINLRCNVIDKSGVSVTLNDAQELILRVQ